LLLAVLVITACIFEVGDLSHQDHRIVFAAVHESQELRRHVSCELQRPTTVIHIHVIVAACPVDAVIPHQLAERMAMYCRLVDEATDLALGYYTFCNDKAPELVDDEVAGFQVLEPVGEKVYLCKRKEALLDV
jgi:hypothetical protein